MLHSPGLYFLPFSFAALTLQSYHCIKSQLWERLYPESPGSPSKSHNVRWFWGSSTVGPQAPRSYGLSALYTPERPSSLAFWSHCIPFGNILVAQLCGPNWKSLFKLDLVPQICNPSYSGAGSKRIPSSRPAWALGGANHGSSVRPHLRIKSRKRAGDAAQW